MKVRLSEVENIVFLLSRSENNMTDSGHVTCGDDHEADIVDEGEPALQQLSANPAKYRILTPREDRKQKLAFLAKISAKGGGS